MRSGFSSLVRVESWSNFLKNLISTPRASAVLLILEAKNISSTTAATLLAIGLIRVSTYGQEVSAGIADFELWIAFKRLRFEKYAIRNPKSAIPTLTS